MAQQQQQPTSGSSALVDVDNLLANLGKGPAERAAAYTELGKLVTSSPAAGAGISSSSAVRTVHIGGLPGELEDESKLEKLFSRFGTVVGTTVRVRHEGKKVSWALISFATPEQAQNALDSTADLSAQYKGLVSRELDEVQAVHSTGAMGQVMRKHTISRLERRMRDQKSGDVAVASISALCLVMCREASEVDIEEYQRVAMLIDGLCKVDRDRVSSQLIRAGETNFFDVCSSTTSALGVAITKDPQDLTEADVLAFASMELVMTAWIPKNMDVSIDGAGANAMEIFAQLMGSHCLLFGTGRAMPEDDRNLAVVELGLGMLRKPGAVDRGLLKGFWFMMMQSALGRPAVGQRLYELEALDLALEALQQSGPLQWISASAVMEPGHCGMVFSFIKDVVEGMMVTGTDITPILVSSGYIDMLVSALRAFEQLGVQECCDTIFVYGVLQAMAQLNEGSCLPQIEDKFRKAEKALRFCIDCGNDIKIVAAFGWTAGVYGTIVAANLFGKEEDSDFQFAQHDIDAYIQFSTEIFRPTSFGFVWQLNAKQFHGFLNICISDRNKRLLLNNADFISFLTDVLLLDPDHPRKDTTESVKAAIQRDVAEAILQFSLFPEGCEALKADPKLVDAVTKLVIHGWSDEAKDCATRTLMTFHPEEIDLHDVERDHIMISYQVRFAVDSPDCSGECCLVDLVRCVRARSGIIRKWFVCFDRYWACILLPMLCVQMSCALILHTCYSVNSLCTRR
jgi:hypothetical protein